MAVSPKWKFVLARSSDLGQVADLSKAKDRNLTLTLNRAGTCSFSLSLEDEHAGKIWPYSSAIKAYRRGSGKTWKLIWSGYVTSVDENFTTGRMTVNSVGWLQRLEKRVLRRPKDYTGVNPATGLFWRDCDIIWDLLSDANATVLDWDNGYRVPVIAGANPNTPSLLQKGDLFPATNDPVWATHTRRYTMERYVNVLNEISRLTDLENGCEVWVDPETRQLHVYHKRLTDRPRAQFGWGTKARNLKDFSRQIDHSVVVNWFTAMGDASVVPQYADTQTFSPPSRNPPLLGENSQLAYGLLEETQAISEASSNTVLSTFAAGEIFLRSTPRFIYSLTPLPYTVQAGPGRIPEPFIEYDVGDVVYLSAIHAQRIDLRNQGLRLFGITVSPDDNGNEIIGQLQVSP